MRLRILLTTLVLSFPFQNLVSFAESHSSTTSNVEAEQSSWQKAKTAIKRGIRLDLNESGTSYAKLMFSGQFWVRAIDVNPGSLDVTTGDPLDLYVDFAVRRARWMAFANFENRIIFFSQIGITSFARNASNRNPFYLHDLQGQIQYIDGHYIGAGLHFWQGLARDSRIAHTGYLTLDNEGYNFPNVNIDDWVVRQIGPFMRGMIGHLGYSFAVGASATSSSRLLSDEAIAQAAEDRVARLRRHSNFSLRGYLHYSLLKKDKALNSGSFLMTYHGKKGAILNLGAGFQYMPEAIGYWDEGSQQVEVQESLALASDIFFELPLANNSAFNAYISYHYYDFGPNFLRTQHVMGGYATADPNSSTLLPGPGHVIYAWGTGHVVHGELGYIIPWKIADISIQPFVAATWRDLKALNEASLSWRVGVNWLIIGHNLKVTADYAIRPLYAAETLKVADHLGAFILQLQLRI